MAQYVPTRWVDSETLITADRLNKLENGVKDALPSADAATVAKTGSYNDLNNKPTIPPAYTLPYATSSVLGGVKPLWKIAEATQPVYVDSAGRLYTVPSSSGGGGGGSDGYSPSATVVKIGDTATIVITDKDGPTSAEIKDGKTPVKGTDYFTASDKSELVQQVISALPTWTGGSF